MDKILLKLNFLLPSLPSLLFAFLLFLLFLLQMTSVYAYIICTCAYTWVCMHTCACANACIYVVLCVYCAHTYIYEWVCMYVGAYGFYSFRMEGQWSLRSLWNGSSFTDWLVTSPLLHVTASAIKENAVFKRWKKILCKQSNNLFFPQRSTGHIPLTRMVR